MSQEPITLNFNFATGGINHDADTNETSDAIKIDENYVWSIQPIKTGLVNGPPNYTVEVSNDGVVWDDYSVASTGVDINDPIDDNHLSFNYFRIKHVANGATAGTIKYPINLKKV